MKKQSSIDFLIKQLGIKKDGWNNSVIKQAKEMHKQETIETYNEGYRIAEIDCDKIAFRDISEFDNAIIYYKNTYEKEN